MLRVVEVQMQHAFGHVGLLDAFEDGPAHVFAQQEQERRLALRAAAQLHAGEVHASGARLRRKQQVIALALRVDFQAGAVRIGQERLLHTPAGDAAAQFLGDTGQG